MKKTITFLLALLVLSAQIGSAQPPPPPPPPGSVIATPPPEPIPPAPIRGTYSGLNVLSMGIPLILIAGIAAIILTTPGHHAHN